MSLGYSGAALITGAFIAVHAEIVDQKLNVTGGVLDWISVPKVGSVDDAGNPIGGLFYLVTLMQAGPDDQQKPQATERDFAPKAFHDEMSSGFVFSLLQGFRRCFQRLLKSLDDFLWYWAHFAFIMRD